MRSHAAVVVAVILASLFAASCSEGSIKGTRLTLAGNSVSRILYERGLLPAFEKHYAQEHPGYKVEFTESYDGSGAQLRAIEAGLRANVAVLSLSPEIDKLADDGLATKNWAKDGSGVVPATSVVVLEVRKGNPKNIRDWGDILRPDVNVILPNPDTSGAAQWNIAAFDAWLRTYAVPTNAGEQNGGDAAEVAQLARLRRRVQAFGKSAKEAQQIFSSGLGDVLVGWESEALDRKEAGDPIDVVYPSMSVEMEPPVAAITPNGETTNAAALEFVKWLTSSDAQRIFAQNFYRPRDPQIAKEFASTFPTEQNIITIEQLGGWKTVKKRLFGSSGLWDKAAES